MNVFFENISVHNKLLELGLDLNYLEDYDSEIDTESVFLTNSENNIIKFLPDGSLSSI